MKNVQPTKPAGLDALTIEVLEGLSRFPDARPIVLGGYLALKHYVDYRLTHDADAWWDGIAGEKERADARTAILLVMSGCAQRLGLALNTRRFGDTESWELLRDGRKVFSFQISARTLQLEPYQPSPWPPLQIETLADSLVSQGVPEPSSL